MELPQGTKKLYELLTIGTKKVHLELSVTNGDNDSKSKLEVSDPYLRQRLKGFGVEEDVVFCACAVRWRREAICVVKEPKWLAAKKAQREEEPKRPKRWPESRREVPPLLPAQVKRCAEREVLP